MSMLCALRYKTCQHFIIAMYGVTNYSLHMAHLVAFYAKLNEIYRNKMNFILRWKFLSVYIEVCTRASGLNVGMTFLHSVLLH